MRYLWFSWKDSTHPRAGGAECVTDALLTRLARDGHEVHLITAGYAGSAKESVLNGYRITRLGNKWTVYGCAFIYYQKHVRAWADIVIDEMNVLPFFCQFFTKEPTVLFVHQLCRRVWFYQITFPLSVVGYLLEPLYVWLLRKSIVITISLSTKKNLLQYGFSEKNIFVIPEGVSMRSAASAPNRKDIQTVLSFGSIRPMKRTHHILLAFEIAKQTLPELKLLIVGKPVGKYGKKILQSIVSSKYKNDIMYYGSVDEGAKKSIFSKADILCCTSVKEGWGLVVTEANTQGIPAVVYDVDGLRDSVHDGITGLVVSQQPAALAQGIIRLIKDLCMYQTLQHQCLVWANTLTQEHMYQEFLKTLPSQKK